LTSSFADIIARNRDLYALTESAYKAATDLDCCVQCLQAYFPPGLDVPELLAHLREVVSALQDLRADKKAELARCQERALPLY